MNLNLKALYSHYQDIRSIPRSEINLMLDTAKENPFYHDVTKTFYRDARKFHRKLPLIKQLEWGVALCDLPGSFDEYFMMIEGAARRNYKKAKRLGYQFQLLEDYNNRLEEVTEIRHSATVRQGKISEEFLSKKAEPHNDPVSLDPDHAYPYFGVVDKDGKLRAYASCLIAGELCMLEHIYGHAKYQSDGYVPLLIVSIAEYLFEHYPNVRYYGYGTYFGASETMKRFKRKFHFLPHKVNWQLDS